MTKVTIDEITYSVTVAEENVNVTVADATSTVQIQIASGASDTQVLSSGGGSSLVVGSTGGVTTLKSISAGDNVTFSDDGNKITISATEDDLSNNTSDDLTEGTTNLYYTDARVQTKLGSVSAHIIPDTHLAYNLGSVTKAWHSAFVGPGSLYIDGQKVLGSDVNDDIDITTDAGQNLHISAGADVVVLPQAGAVNQEFNVELNTINLGQDTGGVTVNVHGTLSASTVALGDLSLSGTLFHSTLANQNLEIRTTGTGYLHANVADLYVGPLAGAIKIDENSISTTDATQLTIEGFTNSADMTTAINTAETNANDYTDTREIAITTAYQTYADQAEADAITSSNSYADTAISNLVDSAPATLDTLNELAAALGDDANFSTTVTNSIATKWTQDNTKISNWDTAYGWGDHSVEGYLTSYTETDPVFTASQAFDITATNKSNWNTAYGWGDHSVVGYITDYTVTESDVTAHQAALSITESQISDLQTYLTAETNDLSSVVTWANVPDANITQSSVTQHQAALSITESQISDLTHFTTADARDSVSLITDNAASMSYNNITGVFTYNDPTGGGPVASATRIVEGVRNQTGSTIPAGSAVYLDGVSGTTPLVHLADNDAAGSFPAVGIVLSSISNNSNGEIVTFGEIVGFDTTGYASNDVLYLSATAGQLTNVRPSTEANAIQNVARVMRPNLSNGSIIVMGAGRANDVPNLNHLNVFIGNSGGVEKRQLTTADILEDASNLFYTDARAQAVIDTNTAGFITTYDPTEADITQHQAALSITESQISDLQSYLTAETNDLSSVVTWANVPNANITQGSVTQHQAALSITESQISNLTHYTNANAITAVEGEATLALAGQVTFAQDIDVSGIITVDDGLAFGAFDPYTPLGLPATAMPTTVMGVGQEDGWGGITIRSRGEHAWGLTGYGIPNEPPKSLLVLTTGRKDGTDDDYLNNADSFGQLQFNPYSGYKTGAEWLTPSAMIESVATENHSATGLGTKLVFNTTTNGAQAGSTDIAHTDASLTLQGTTITTSGTLKIDDDLIVTGGISNDGGDVTVNDTLKVNGSVASKHTKIGDSVIGPYALHGAIITAGDTSWSGISLVEHSGANKPIANFTNPAFATTVFGGTVASPSAVLNNQRVWSSFALTSPDGSTPSTANFRMLGVATQDQTTSARGVKFSVETTPNGANSTTESLMIQHDTLTVNTGGNGVIKTGGNLSLDDDVTVTGTLDVNGTATLKGNVTLGDANTDVIAVTGKLAAANGFNNTVLNTATAQYLDAVLGIVVAGDQAYISDGNGGTACMAFFDGSDWKRFHAPDTNIASS